MAFSRFRWLFPVVILICSFKSVSVEPHPLYVSITELNYNEKAHTIEISCKIFTDDLEKALKKKTGKSLHISAAQDPVIVAAISDYLKAHFNLTLDKQIIGLRYLGYELEKEAVWSYLEGSVAVSPKTALISNSILYDSFEQQINLVHFTIHGERRSTKLVNPDSKVELDF